MKTHPSLFECESAEVFETLRTYQGKLFRLDQHMQRLFESAKSTGLRHRITLGQIKRQAQDALKSPKQQDVMLRVMLGKRGVRMMVRPLHPYPKRLFLQGVKLATTVVCLPSPGGVEGRVKSRDFLSGVLAHAECVRPDVFDALLLSAQGHVAEAPTSNIFIVRKGKLLTPPLSEGILDGVTRRYVLELACQENIACTEEVILRHDLYTADECFLTNTSMELMPVVNVDGREIGTGKPGPLTKHLRQTFQFQVTQHD